MTILMKLYKYTLLKIIYQSQDDYAFDFVNKADKNDNSEDDSIFGSSSSTNENEKRKMEERRRVLEEKRQAKLQEIEAKKASIFNILFI